MTRRGFALLEALVALTLITTVGVSVVVLGQTAVRAEQKAAEEELQFAAADRLLSAVSLLRRGELDQRLGTNQVGEFAVTVERPEPRLYRVSLARESAPERTLLVTVVFRPVDATK
jgi:type II secretory pathway pseudopilin PulG